MVVVALDTSAFMVPVELEIRVFDELDRLLGNHERVVPRSVLAELSRLADGAGTEARAARVGLDLAERCRTIDEPTASGGTTDDPTGTADDALVDLARSGDVDYVVTADRPLRDRLLEVGTPVVGVRGRNRLAITEP